MRTARGDVGDGPHHRVRQRLRQAAVDAVVQRLPRPEPVPAHVHRDHCRSGECQTRNSMQSLNYWDREDDNGRARRRWGVRAEGRPSSPSVSYRSRVALMHRRPAQ